MEKEKRQSSGRMLIVVDPQIDFIIGSLPVGGAAAAMDALAGYISSSGNTYDAIVITADNHPYRHCSFSDCGGQWPRHCVAHSAGAALWQPVLDAAWSCGVPVYLLPKGEDADREEYSVFQAPGAAERLAAIVSELGIESAEICGIAGDVCVLSTLRDALEQLPVKQLRVLTRFSPSIDGGAALNRFIEENSILCDR